MATTAPRKLDADCVNSVCTRLISAAGDSEALWVSSLAIRAALNRGRRRDIKRILGLGEGSWPPTDVAFLPLHDADHWSLLVLYRSKGMDHAYHYDSVPGMHSGHAVGVVSMLCRGGLLRSKRIRIHRVTSWPSQASAWECGWYLIRAGQMILSQAAGPGLTRVVRPGPKAIRIAGAL